MKKLMDISVRKKLVRKREGREEGGKRGGRNEKWER